MKNNYSDIFSEIYNEKWAFGGKLFWNIVYKKVISKNKIKPENWLDLCCGTGSLLKIICKNKIKAYGLDNSKSQLKYAAINSPESSVFHKDIRNFQFDIIFDIITCFFDSLNHITKKQEIKSIFKNVYKHLNERGFFIFDINIIEGYQEAWGHNVVFKDKDKFSVIENIFNKKNNKGIFYITIFKKEQDIYKRFDEKHVERCYHENEIDNMLNETGFRYNKIDWHTWNSPRKRNGRMIYICNKK